MKTPYFLIKETELDKNILSFKTALNNNWPNSVLGYSIKTNSLPWVLKHMHKFNVFAEAVSDEEYQLAKMCGYKDNEIIFNGPIKSNGQLKTAIDNGAIVNIDSQHELAFIKNNNFKRFDTVGLRLNIDVDMFLLEDVGFREDGFRFGFSEEDGCLKEAIELLRSNDNELQLGLHLHCNSVTRSLEVYKCIAKYASRIIKKYDLIPSYIDIGGGFFGGIEGKPTADQYISVITKELSKVVDKNKTTLIIEPGSAIIGSTIDLHTTVVDAKITKHTRIITTDGSRIHLDPFWKKENYMYSIISKNTNRYFGKQVICGYTCMDHDRIMQLNNEIILNEGDKIIYHRVGAYTMTFGGPFIRYFPDVYVESSDTIYHIRKEMSVEKYYEIQTN
ncbi:MAG: diaminopimelate decarboxylase [Clostridia bacterium]